MPFKDPLKQREYQRLWAAKRLLDPTKHEHILKNKRIWAKKNKDKIVAWRKLGDTEKRKTYYANYKKSQKGKETDKKYRSTEKGKNTYRLSHSKSRYGKYAEAHRVLMEINLNLSKLKLQENI